MTHALVGVGTSCGPTYYEGHEHIFPNDILYSGSQPLGTSPTLDVGHDDYYGHNKANCPHLEQSPLLTT
jgi:hypothetical protein